MDDREKRRADYNEAKRWIHGHELEFVELTILLKGINDIEFSASGSFLHVERHENRRSFQGLVS